MKKSILFIISILLSSAVFSQITLNSSYNLLPGDNYRMDIYDEIPSMDPGPAGANQTWDFSSIPGGVYIPGEESFCIDPEGTPYADSSTLATANLCIRGPGTTNEGPFAYYNFGSNSQTLLGIGNSQSGGVSFVHYDDALSNMVFPCSYGDVMSDNYEFRLFNSASGMYFMKDSGSVHTVVDAWGSITTPTGTYDNTIRLLTTTVSSTWMNFGMGWTFVGTSTLLDYTWYAENIKVNVMSITEFTDFVGYSVTYLVDHNFPVGIKEQEEISFSLYPNPASEKVNIKSKKEIKEVRIFSMDGRLLQSQQLAQGKVETSLDIGALANGLYIVELRFEKAEVSHMSLVKQ